MKNDLVERLRSIDRAGVMHARHPKNPHPTCAEAANAIEALSTTPGREEIAEAALATRHRTASTAALTAEIQRLREACTKARDQFAFYRDEHLKAGKDEKAATNHGFYVMLACALAPLSTPSEVSEPVADESGGEGRRAALIERLGTIADLACKTPLQGELGDVAYELLRQAAAQIASDKLRFDRLTTPPNPTNGDAVREAEAIGGGEAETIRGPFLPMEAWDKRDEAVLLLVDYREGDHPLNDAEFAITIGHNNDHNVGAGEGQGWQFAGWCWTHDHYVDGRGTPIGWLPLPHILARAATAFKDEPANPKAASMGSHKMLLALLATLHSDGGHKTQEIGLRLSYKQALEIAAQKAQSGDAVREALKIAELIDVQASSLEGYAESSGYAAKPVLSVFHLQAGHSRDLANRLRATLAKHGGAEG